MGRIENFSVPESLIDNAMFLLFPQFDSEKDIMFISDVLYGCCDKINVIEVLVSGFYNKDGKNSHHADRGIYKSEFSLYWSVVCGQWSSQRAIFSFKSDRIHHSVSNELYKRAQTNCQMLELGTIGQVPQICGQQAKRAHMGQRWLDGVLQR